VEQRLTVGAVASASGVTPDAIRYYERLRLLSRATRTSSGYRVFETGTIGRVKTIRRAQSLGLSLAEIGALFPIGRLGRAQCRGVRSLLADKIAATDEQIERLRKFGRELGSYLTACDRALASGRETTCPVFSDDIGGDRRVSSQPE
jgi:DNA-binding transcriptional MerR regulator